MPVTSKAQFRLMAAIAHGAKLSDKPEGLSKEKAEEFIHATPSYKALPEHKNNKLHRLSKLMKK